MLSEFDFIQNIKRKFGLKLIGDDCAVLPKDQRTDLVITADLLIEGIDFRLEWAVPKLLGHKALAVSISDVGAMGAVPVWAMLSLGLPENVWKTGFAEALFEGFHGFAAERGIEIVGGDVSRTPERIVLDSIVVGEVPKGTAVLRSGARPGDAVYVTGALGGAAAGLRSLEQGHRLEKTGPDWRRRLIRRQLQPQPPESTSIREAGATAMIDLSDGLSADLGHICDASRVGATIFADRVPFEEDAKHLGLSSRDQLDLALNGGEDFELLFTIPPDRMSPELKARCFQIGEITETAGIIELIDGDNREILSAGGYRHF